MANAFHAWKVAGVAVLAYETTAASRPDVPFITDKVRPQPSPLRLAVSVAAGLLVAQSLRPLPRPARYVLATVATLDLVDHFRPGRCGFWPFATTKGISS